MACRSVFPHKGGNTSRYILPDNNVGIISVNSIINLFVFFAVPNAALPFGERAFGAEITVDTETE